MRVLITENRLYSSLEKYILNGYPMVRDVTFSTREVKLASGSFRERKTIQRHIINIKFDADKMEYSPTLTLKQIRNDINSMFSFDIDGYGSEWGLEYKMIRD